ncbi:MAG: alpha-galactosidase [Saccharofermentans sp.]|nr:alpha-galactosidase [Saccharofermentans sp.]
MDNGRPSVINDSRLRFDSFANRSDELFTKKERLPAMGWNSWNAFGSGNTEALTREMASKIKELGLDKLGYKYIVLDDGCYKPERVNGRLQADEVKFPSGFRALADYIHSLGLKFGMYNDIGTRLCSGAEVGIYGYEKEDCEDYINWDIDFIKVDNCYYMWDNATFAEPSNAKYSYAPNIKSITVEGKTYYSTKDAVVTGTRAEAKGGYVSFIGTFDGTAPDHTPVGLRSSELIFEIESSSDRKAELTVNYAAGEEEGVGSWLQVAVDDKYFFDEMLPLTKTPDTFTNSAPISIELKAGMNMIRIMNHRRQENTLHSYALIKEMLIAAGGDKDIVFSICEWGKTQPQDWGHKVGDSWRILNDITFQVGSDGNNGNAAWESDYTTSVTSQYNKAVIMDEYSGLLKGWNDPDMLVIGMDRLNFEMYRSHMAMWCMMNAPLMLGMDLRRVKVGDDIHKIIADEDLIALNQDPLGIQAKRIFTTFDCESPDKTYIRDNDRIDVLAKPLSDGSVALAFFNISTEDKVEAVSVSREKILSMIGSKMVNPEKFKNASSFHIRDLINKDEQDVSEDSFGIVSLGLCDCKVIKVTPI